MNVTSRAPWEAMYEPGNVSSALIGYLADEATAKAAAEAWVHANFDDVGDLKWDKFPTSGEYEEWWELAEVAADGAITDPGVVVRRLAQQAREAS